MRIVGVVPGAKLFGSEDLYADHYLFVNGYPKRIAACGGTPIGVLSSDGYVIPEALAARASIPIIFRSWNTRPDPVSPCSASASVCR